MVHAYKNGEDSIHQFIPCSHWKSVSETTLVVHFLIFQTSWKIFARFHVLYFRKIKPAMNLQADQQLWLVLGMSQGQPILCYRKYLAAPSMLEKWALEV